MSAEFVPLALIMFAFTYPSRAVGLLAPAIERLPRPALDYLQLVGPAVLTALEKLPADRFTTATEFAEALQDKSYASTVTLPAAPRPAAPGRTAAGRRADLLVPALVTALAVAVGAALWGWFRPQPTPLLTQFSLGLRRNQLLQAPLPSGGARIALSPDGRAMVYSGPADGGSRLWFRPLDQLDATPIAGTENGSSPFFSPDGKRVGFIKEGTQVRIASLAGAPTVTLTDKANTTSGDWGDDGYIYFEVDSGVARMRASGGEIEPVYVRVTSEVDIVFDVTFGQQVYAPGAEVPFQAALAEGGALLGSAPFGRGDPDHVRNSINFSSSPSLL